MRIAWIGYLDFDVFHGGGELTQRRLAEAGRRRGHSVAHSGFLRRRPQRALRRTGLYRTMRIDWDADLFILANLSNAPHLRQRISPEYVERALSTGRALVMANGWVDTCALDLPCGGDRHRCPPICDRGFGNWLFGEAAGAIFVSPYQRDLTASVLDVDMPASVLVRPMVDPDVFRPLGLERDIDVLYVGTISAHKGYYELLSAFGAERLTFAGPNHLGHEVRGTHLGEVSQDRLPEIYNRARIFAHLPRWHEPQGRTVVEAALCGCQVITNERVGVMSYDRPHRENPDVIRDHPEMFWQDLEAFAGSLK